MKTLKISSCYCFSPGMDMEDEVSPETLPITEDEEYEQVLINGESVFVFNFR